ncbi:MAG: glycosyltransferase family 4 protein [bacterium]|nr:glycosyltransferase family 4 protein [bacterium]
MKITFFADDKKWSQLSNGGGTRTIILSAETLRGLGHKVSIVAHKDTFNWIEHPKPIRTVPSNTDILIAVTISDVKHVMKYKGMRLAYWSRPVETWQVKKDKALHTLKKFRDIGGIVMSNSSWQVEWLKKHGIKSRLVYSGIDLDFWKDTGGIHRDIGGLINKRHKSKRSDIVKKCATVHLKGNLKPHAVRDLYNQCSVWLATSTKEGFHNCPAEAALAGCYIIGVDCKRNGTSDYLTEETGALYKTEEELMHHIGNPDFSKIPVMQKLIRNKIGSRRKNMKRMVEVLGG